MHFTKNTIASIALLIVCNTVLAQLSGGLESNIVWYTNDAKIKLDPIEAKNKVRSNNYLGLDYAAKKFTFGLQAEAYQSKAILNYAPTFKGANLATYYANYKNDSIGIDVTVGHFYEQFGSGLVLRSWEDRPLGIANSIVGAKVKYHPTNNIELTALYGKQRNGLGFQVADGSIFGVNAEANITQLLKAKKAQYTVGGSFVNRNNPSIINAVKANTYLTSARASMQLGAFQADVEYAFKSADALVEFGNIKPQFQFDGDAYLLNASYSKKGFGISGNFRRLENFGIYSQRNYMGNIYNQGIVNYTPSLTKQYDYSLTNIYVYAAQPNIGFEPDRNKAGEIGGQVEAVYQLKPKSKLGGKLGTTLTLNFAQYHGLQGTYIAAERKYKANLAAFGVKYYSELGAEVRKKWTPKLTTILTYLNQYYNAKYVAETVGTVTANTVVVENIIKLKKGNSIRQELQHQWANGENRNWAAALLEYNYGSRYTFYITNLYNYGNTNTNQKLHFYNAGIAYKLNALRLQANYGRQRGGLVCLGGVCRFVPQSAGVSLSINYSF